jgi:hypothetical protein
VALEVDLRFIDIDYYSLLYVNCHRLKITSLHGRADDEREFRHFEDTSIVGHFSPRITKGWTKKSVIDVHKVPEAVRMNYS